MNPCLVDLSAKCVARHIYNLGSTWAFRNLTFFHNLDRAIQLSHRKLILTQTLFSFVIQIMSSTDKDKECSRFIASITQEASILEQS